MGSPPAHGQDLIDRYRRARVQDLARALPMVPAARLITRGGVADTLDGTSAPDTTQAPPAPETPAFAVEKARALIRLEREWFRDRFADTRWSFLGSGAWTVLDTTHTRVLRARLQAQFGDPTQTLADVWRNARGAASGSRQNGPGSNAGDSNADAPALRDATAQFEYWFVVNDSIPVIVTDTRGPYDRGLIVSSDQRYRDRLPALRRAVLAPIAQSDSTAPYVDYYRDAQTRRWYRTGYDGRTYFLRRTYPYRVTPGRRPRLTAADSTAPPIDEALARVRTAPRAPADTAARPTAPPDSTDADTVRLGPVRTDPAAADSVQADSTAWPPPFER
jgi:hypothetical protein